MEKHGTEERRKHPRVNANIVVSYHIHEEVDNYDLSQSKNVSQGGMLLTTNRKFEEGTRLGMTVLFPFSDDKTRVLGEVVDSKEMVKDILYDTRFRFCDLEEQLSRGLDNFVNEHLESESDE